MILGGHRKTALSFVDIERVSRFIVNFAEQQSIILLGRIPCFKRDDVKVLPICETKASVWRAYKSAAVGDERDVRYSTFRRLWSQLLPFVVICKPMSDLCWICQANNTRIVQQVNVPEDEKSAVLRQQERHLEHAWAKRSHYQQLCAQSRAVALRHNLLPLHFTPHMTNNIRYHYSFDFAQQVHYPCDPQQPGAIYFKTLQKCQIFGIHAEGISKQVNYLGMSVSCGKGANVVISYLHHFLTNYSSGEHHLQLNADNCAGQNKNNAMMWYLAWRVTSGLNASASITFLHAGHTVCTGLVFRLVEAPLPPHQGLLHGRHCRGGSQVVANWHQLVAVGQRRRRQRHCADLRLEGIPRPDVQDSGWPEEDAPLQRHCVRLGHHRHQRVLRQQVSSTASCVELCWQACQPSSRQWASTTSENSTSIRKFVSFARRRRTLCVRVPLCVHESSSDEDDEPVAKLARTSATSAAGSCGRDRDRGRGKGCGKGHTGD